jgi:hypothetical protein
VIDVKKTEPTKLNRTLTTWQIHCACMCYYCAACGTTALRSLVYQTCHLIMCCLWPMQFMDPRSLSSASVSTLVSKNVPLHACVAARVAFHISIWIVIVCEWIKMKWCRAVSGMLTFSLKNWGHLGCLIGYTYVLVMHGPATKFFTFLLWVGVLSAITCTGTAFLMFRSE